MGLDQLVRAARAAGAPAAHHGLFSRPAGHFGKRTLTWQREWPRSPSWKLSSLLDFGVHELPSPLVDVWAHTVSHCLGSTMVYVGITYKEQKGVKSPQTLSTRPKPPQPLQPPKAFSFRSMAKSCLAPNLTLPKEMPRALSGPRAAHGVGFLEFLELSKRSSHPKPFKQATGSPVQTGHGS